MQKYLNLLLLSHVLFSWQCEAIEISSYDANLIAEKIWQNECGGKFQGLTSWNQGENFASLGIGHFLWYPSQCKEPFQDTFPDLMKFMLAEGAKAPQWLQEATTCPWHSREEFQLQMQSPKMMALREFLYATKELQARYMAIRLEKALPQITANLSQIEQERVTTIFYRLAEQPDGLYALMDYLNFKGLGLAPKENYHGQGWGLRQVLLAIPESSLDPLHDFMEAAKYILTKRVQNSPPERNEKRWLKGWLNRIQKYKVNDQ